MRLIDADALLYTMNDRFKEVEDSMMRYGYIFAESVVLEAPTIDAEPIVHAMWKAGPEDDDGDRLYRCTNCKYGIITCSESMLEHGFNIYCPHCGAKMSLDSTVS